MHVKYNFSHVYLNCHIATAIITNNLISHVNNISTVCVFANICEFCLSFNESKMESKPLTIDDIGELITKHAQENPGGLSNTDLSELLPIISKQDRVDSINKLIQEGYLEILTRNNSLIYRYKDPSKKPTVPKSADNEEKIVYSIIEEADNKGIWIRDIRVKSNLIMTQLNKILKNLESRKLIKAVKSVNASKKKVYMLYNMEPDRTVTGGAWYQDQDFESEFVDILNQQSLRFLQMKLENAKKLNDGPLATKKMACCTVKQVHTFISELGISKVVRKSPKIQSYH